MAPEKISIIGAFRVSLIDAVHLVVTDELRGRSDWPRVWGGCSVLLGGVAVKIEQPYGRKNRKKGGAMASKPTPSSIVAVDVEWFQ